MNKFVIFVMMILFININNKKVFESCLSKASLKKVWERIGKFDDLTWVDENIQIKLEHKSNFLPTRVFKFGDLTVHEKLLINENLQNQKSVTYKFVKGFEAFKVDNYVAKLTAKRITLTNETFVSWECDFDLRNGQDGEYDKLENLFKNTISKISNFFLIN
jgi:hypothetical protein